MNVGRSKRLSFPSWAGKMRGAFRPDTRRKSRTVFTVFTVFTVKNSSGRFRCLRFHLKRLLCLVAAEASQEEQRDHRAQGVQQSPRRAEAPDIPPGNFLPQSFLKARKRAFGSVRRVMIFLALFLSRACRDTNFLRVSRCEFRRFNCKKKKAKDDYPRGS